MIPAQIILLLIAFLFGLHDGCTHRDNRLITPAKRKLWHFSGGSLYAAFVLVLIIKYWNELPFTDIQVPIYFVFPDLVFIPAALIICAFCMSVAAVILRAAIFDIGYNVGASITPTYIGDGVENIEAAMVKIFGKQGAYYKALSFLALLVWLNLIFK